MRGTQALDLEQIAIPQDGLERGHLRVGPHHGDTVVAGFLGKLADIDLEVLAAGLEVTAVGRVADQCLVALLELCPEAGDDRLAVGLVLLGLGVIAADDVVKLKRNILALPKERYRPEGGFAHGAKCVGGIPPALRTSADQEALIYRHPVRPPRSNVPRQ
ncbi:MULTISPECIES: hypothetical protein [unclassified Mesorhizobium]|uniref:hypothetical protein n=1 Tax=unclassified Mesorhizobium TaxID=325217 RepID=UPI0025782AB8|nr:MULTISPECIES: hypothetical protein [unclassified Mesorhizobium]WJI80944.1 hypothetical protein NLY34_29820 [Mesorhizobium sp. C374B]WJI87482.1 hypothetical protein NLY42_00570 [Mesorhizobium sp. C372A]